MFHVPATFLGSLTSESAQTRSHPSSQTGGPASTQAWWLCPPRTDWARTGQLVAWQDQAISEPARSLPSTHLPWPDRWRHSSQDCPQGKLCPGSTGDVSGSELSSGFSKHITTEQTCASSVRVRMGFSPHVSLCQGRLLPLTLSSGTSSWKGV